MVGSGCGGSEWVLGVALPPQLPSWSSVVISRTPPATHTSAPLIRLPETGRRPTCAPSDAGLLVIPIPSQPQGRPAR